MAAAVAYCTQLLAADSPIGPDRTDPRPLRDRIFFFAGGDLARDNYFAWSGIVAAPQGLLHEDGPRLRVMAGTGRYRYRTGAVASGVNEGRIVSGELMLGFRRAIGQTIATLFIGAHIENQTLAAPIPVIAPRALQSAPRWHSNSSIASTQASSPRRPRRPQRSIAVIMHARRSRTNIRRGLPRELRRRSMATFATTNRAPDSSYKNVTGERPSRFRAVIFLIPTRAAAPTRHCRCSRLTDFNHVR